MSSKSRITLTVPHERFAESYLECMAEMRNLGEKVWEMTVPLAHENIAQFVARLLRAESSPEPGLVPETTYWAVLDEKIIGRIALRHTLNKNLEEFGGHIGYEVCPSSRKRGAATEMLRLVLQTPRAKEIGRVLLTCAPDNTASNKTIQKNGGVLSATKFVERVQRQTNYYWIDVKAHSRLEKVQLRRVNDEQEEFSNLQKVLEAAPAFSQRTTGAHPDASAAQSMITALPPNKTHQDKFVFVAYREDVPVGCVDLIRGYPDANTAWIGLLLIDEALHGQGLGRLCYEKTEQQISSWSEITSIRLSVVATNSVAVPFWQKMGFSLTGESKPYKHGSIESEVILMRKALL